MSCERRILICGKNLFLPFCYRRRLWLSLICLLSIFRCDKNQTFNAAPATTKRAGNFRFMSCYAVPFEGKLRWGNQENLLAGIDVVQWQSTGVPAVPWVALKNLKNVMRSWKMKSSDFPSNIVCCSTAKKINWLEIPQKIFPSWKRLFNTVLRRFMQKRS